MDSLAARLVQIRPQERQVQWQKNECTAFFHFGVNTFTNREWGTGKESPALFAPTALDTDQWCRALRAAGMRACILTAKHHDGFCLWDTKYTGHSVMHSPLGRDVVALLSDSCRRHGLKLGLYLSPWDRHEPCYGTGDAYNDFFCAQLEELLTGYGPLYCLWFDGACGEGPNGRRQAYDWERMYALIRKHQPHACISVCGPDVRWCGNEAGIWRESEWSVVPERLRDCERIQEASQQREDASFREQAMQSGDMDLGSRAVMAKAEKWVWYPAEVNTSIRPGWFYHPEEDDRIKPLDTLLSLYEHTVGGNAVLLLNIPPDKNGLIAPPDVARLKAFGASVEGWFAENHAPQACITADEAAYGNPPENALTDDDAYWKPQNGTEAATLTLRWETPQSISRVVLQEQIRSSQRIERFTLRALIDGEEKLLHEGTVVGYKRICAFQQVTTACLLLRIEESRVCPTIKTIGVYP